MLAALPAGCGNERVRPSDRLVTLEPQGRQKVDYDDAGLSFRAPKNWFVTRQAPPLVATVISGRAVLAIWRYPRRERLPDGFGQLDRARRALIAASRARDRTLDIRSSRVVRINGAQGVELVGEARIGVARRRVRSTHLYAQGAEFVVDAYAPERQFPRLDRLVFRPLTASVRIGRPVRP